MADRPYSDLTAAEAQAIADLLNSVRVQRLAELAEILVTAGVHLEHFDGSLDSLDHLWQWAIGEAREGFPHVSREVRASSQRAFNYDWSDPVSPYVSELITQYVLTVVQRYRSDAHWAPHGRLNTSDYHRPRIATSRGEVEVSPGQYTGLLRGLGDPIHFTPRNPGPDTLRLRIRVFITEDEPEHSGMRESILSPLLGRRFEPQEIPNIATVSPTWPLTPRPSRTGSHQPPSDADFRPVEDYELSRNAADEPWKARALNERVVAEWMTAHGFRTPDGAEATPALLRISDTAETWGTTREFLHHDSDSQLTALSWRGRLRGLALELASQDQTTSQQLSADFAALADRIRGASMRGPL